MNRKEERTEDQDVVRKTSAKEESKKQISQKRNKQKFVKANHHVCTPRFTAWYLWTRFPGTAGDVAE